MITIIIMEMKNWEISNNNNHHGDEWRWRITNFKFLSVPLFGILKRLRSDFQRVRELIYHPVSNVLYTLYILNLSKCFYDARLLIDWFGQLFQQRMLLSYFYLRHITDIFIMHQRRLKNFLELMNFEAK